MVSTWCAWQMKVQICRKQLTLQDIARLGTPNTP